MAFSRAPSPPPARPIARARELRALAIPVACIVLVALSRPAPRAASAIAPVAQPATQPAPSPRERPTKLVAFADGCRTADCHGAMLAAPSLHAPVAHDACNACHAPDAGGHRYPLLRTGDALCRTCHSSPRSCSPDHAPGRLNCTDCHQPHASPGPRLLRAATQAQTCAACHAATDSQSSPAAHSALACAICHAGHPNAASAAPAADQIAACRRCHPAQAEELAASPHNAAKVATSCRACHTMHASDTKSLLAAEPRALCVRCHENVAHAATGRTTHDAVLKDRQCLSCHAAHGSRHGGLLRDNQAAVCAGCHNAPQHAADGRQIPATPAGDASNAYVHGPVAAGDCSTCHTIHGGNEARLLKRVDPAALAAGPDTRNFSLCFLCHDSALLLAESADTTLFRNGPANLHRRHLLSGDRSRTCSACHVAHSGNRPKLMAEMVSFQGSSWQMPLKFQQTDDGGRCAPGCHEPMSYRRDGRPPAALPGGAP